METHCQERENLIGEDLKRRINQKNKSGLKGQQISKMWVTTLESRHIKGHFHWMIPSNLLYVLKKLMFLMTWSSLIWTLKFVWFLTWNTILLFFLSFCKINFIILLQNDDTGLHFFLILFCLLLVACTNGSRWICFGSSRINGIFFTSKSKAHCWFASLNSPVCYFQQNRF